jgi:hypothetical protein
MEDSLSSSKKRSSSGQYPAQDSGEFFIEVPFKALLEKVDDARLSSMHRLVWSEIEKRARQRVDSGSFPELDRNEKDMCRAAIPGSLGFSRYSVIDAYRKRTNIPLHIAKVVVEKYLGR